MDDLIPTLTIAEMLRRWPATARVLIGRRMACVGCEMNRFETIAEAAAAYGASTHELLRDLRRAVDS